MAEDIMVYPGFVPANYDGALWIACVNGSNLPKRVLMSEVLESSGVTKYPHANGWDLPANFRINVDNYINIGKGYIVKPYIFLSTSMDSIGLYCTNLITLDGLRTDVKGANTVAGYTLALANDSGAPTRIGGADVWAIYPSFAADKDDLAPIDEPLEKSTQIRGYTFSQNGEERGGFTIEDIQSHYPLALLHDDKGAVSGYDPNVLLALLYESNRLLEERVSALEAQTG